MIKKILIAFCVVCIVCSAGCSSILSVIQGNNGLRATSNQHDVTTVKSETTIETTAEYIVNDIIPIIRDYSETSSEVATEELTTVESTTVESATEEVTTEKKEIVPYSADDDEITRIAKKCINGEFGNGQVRRQKVAAAGYSYAEVQTRVNEILHIYGITISD